MWGLLYEPPVAEIRVFSVPFSHSGPLTVRKDLDQGEDFTSEEKLYLFLLGSQVLLTPISHSRDRDGG